MPLRDHFHPPLSSLLSWLSLYSGCATRLADALTERAPAEFVGAEFTRNLTPSDIDPYEPFVGSPQRTLPTFFPDSFEVRVFSTGGGLTLAAVVKLVTPADKEQAVMRRSSSAM